MPTGVAPIPSKPVPPLRLATYHELFSLKTGAGAVEVVPRRLAPPGFSPGAGPQEAGPDRSRGYMGTFNLQKAPAEKKSRAKSVPNEDASPDQPDSAASPRPSPAVQDSSNNASPVVKRGRGRPKGSLNKRRRGEPKPTPTPVRRTRKSRDPSNFGFPLHEFDRMAVGVGYPPTYPESILPARPGLSPSYPYVESTIAMLPAPPGLQHAGSPYPPVATTPFQPPGSPTTITPLPADDPLTKQWQQE